MQYLLSEEEHSRLIINKSKAKEVDTAKQALKTVRDYLLNEAAYICVHDREGRYVGYCDGCPCSPLGHKQDYETWKLICGKSTSYGK